MNEKAKLRPQVLATPYQLQDICPMKKMKAPEDTLRRIQKKIASNEKKELAENETIDSSRNTLRTNGLKVQLKQITLDPRWISDSKVPYKSTWKQFYNKENNSDAFEEEWLTSSDIFNKMALVFK